MGASLKGQIIPNTDLLCMIKEEIQNNFRSIMKEEIARGNNGLLAKLDMLTNQLEGQKKEIKSCKEELKKEKQLRKALKQKKISQQETYSRRDNLIFSGVAKERGETDQDCNGKLFKH